MNERQHVVEVAAVSTRLVTCTSEKCGTLQTEWFCFIVFLFVTLHDLSSLTSSLNSKDSGPKIKQLIFKFKLDIEPI